MNLTVLGCLKIGFFLQQWHAAFFFLRWFLLVMLSLVFVRHIDNFSFVDCVDNFSCVNHNDSFSFVNYVDNFPFVNHVGNFSFVSPVDSFFCSCKDSWLCHLNSCQLCGQLAFVSCVDSLAFVSWVDNSAFVSFVDNSAFVSWVDNSLCSVKFMVSCAGSVCGRLLLRSVSLYSAAAWKRSFLLTFPLHLMTDKQLHCLQKRWFISAFIWFV